jgi:hypothetical protein
VEPDLAPRFPLEMLNRIGDVNLPAINSCGFQAFIQEQPGRPDKRPAMLIFTLAGLLSHQKQWGVDEALAENYLSGLLIEIAALTVRCRLLEAAKIVARGQVFQGRPGAGVKQAHCTLMMQVEPREEIEFWGNAGIGNDLNKDALTALLFWYLCASRS